MSTSVRLATQRSDSQKVEIKTISKHEDNNNNKRNEQKQSNKQKQRNKRKFYLKLEQIPLKIWTTVCQHVCTLWIVQFVS